MNERQAVGDARIQEVIEIGKPRQLADQCVGNLKAAAERGRGLAGQRPDRRSQRSNEARQRGNRHAVSGADGVWQTTDRHAVFANDGFPPTPVRSDIQPPRLVEYRQGRFRDDASGCRLLRRGALRGHDSPS